MQPRVARTAECGKRPEPVYGLVKLPSGVATVTSPRTVYGTDLCIIFRAGYMKSIEIRISVEALS